MSKDCPTCNGWGELRDGDDEYLCPTCHGTGEVEDK